MASDTRGSAAPCHRRAGLLGREWDLGGVFEFSNKRLPNLAQIYFVGPGEAKSHVSENNSPMPRTPDVSLHSISKLAVPQAPKSHDFRCRLISGDTARDWQFRLFRLSRPSIAHRHRLPRRRQAHCDVSHGRSRTEAAGMNPSKSLRRGTSRRCSGEPSARLSTPSGAARSRSSKWSEATCTKARSEWTSGCSQGTQRRLSEQLTVVLTDLRGHGRLRRAGGRRTPRQLLLSGRWRDYRTATIPGQA
jgi:hypothetical protein